MYLNRVSLYPEKKICSQMRWESKLLWLPVLLKITYPDLDLPRKTASTVFVLFSLLQAFRQWRVERVIVRGYKKEEGGGGGGGFGSFAHNPTPPLKMWSLQTGTTSTHYSHYKIFNVALLHLRCSIFLQYTIR